MKKTNGLQRLLSCLLAAALLSGLLAAGATASGEQGKEHEAPVWVTETANLGGGAWITNTQTGERYYTFCADNNNPAPGVGIKYEPHALGAWELSPETIAKIGRVLSILYPTDNAGLLDHSYQYNGHYTQQVVWHFTAGIADGSECGYESFLKKMIPEADIPMVIDYIENGSRDPIPVYIPDIHLELQADGSYAGAADYRCTHEASHTPVIGAQLPEGLRVSVERGAGDVYTSAPPPAPPTPGPMRATSPIRWTTRWPATRRRRICACSPPSPGSTPPIKRNTSVWWATASRTPSFKAPSTS